MNFIKLKIASLAFIFLWLLTTTVNAQYKYNEKHIEVSLRMIGHQILLKSGDRTSLVLPIVKNNDQYKIQFENEFVLNPEELSTTINKIVKSTKIANQYIVEVEQCETGQIVYSYEVDNINNFNLSTCTERVQPKSCYSILFTLVKVDGIKTRLQTATTGIGLANYIAILILVLLIGIAGFFVWKKRNEPTSNPNLISIGKYHFNKINTTLLIENKTIELSGKEADLLLLLYSSVNTTIEREVILNKVWKDEGDYVGRTLDVFISKLRKKLKSDPNIKIVNIRGVGYKLVIDN